MTNTELDTFIDRWISNSAVGAFTNRRLNTVLKQLVTGGVTDTFDSIADFRQAITDRRAAGTDWFMRARMRDTSFIYEYFPPEEVGGQGVVNWTASQKNFNI